MTVASGVEPEVLRQVCGHWVTGVAVVAGTDRHGVPLGMAVNSFTSLSLDPPLILFCPALTSSTWPGIRETGRFAVNILAAEQSSLARTFARSGGDKFADVALRTTDDGLPALDGAAARLVCEIEAVHPGGDHEIVVGRVVRAEQCDGLNPLVFHRGRTPTYRFL
jgi:flavin reductase (DIM6/NTAB) family NADH-FMN oxidoreductase RutF